MIISIKKIVTQVLTLVYEKKIIKWGNDSLNLYFFKK